MNITSKYKFCNGGGMDGRTVGRTYERSEGWNLFGTCDIMKMRAFTCTGKVRLEEHIKCIKDYRIRAQTMAQPEDIKRQVNLKK